MKKIDHGGKDVMQEWRGRPWWRRMGPFIPFVVFLGLTLPILSYVFMMTSLGWRTPVFGGALPAAAMGRSGTVYLYDSPAVASYLAGVGGNYAVLMGPWRNYFNDRGRDYLEIRSLSELKDPPGSVLVLPSTITLDEQERARIQAYRAAGGSILATWAVGSRDGAGNWRGWGFLRDLGVTVLGEVPSEESQRQLTMLGETPLSKGLGPGQRVWMTNSSEPLLRIRSELQVARFAGWNRIPQPERLEEGAVVATESSTSRTAAFAFAESTWAASPVATYQLIDNTLAWLRREPTVAVANWPQGYRSAFIIEMDTEDGFRNAAILRDMLRTAKLPATFFLMGGAAIGNSDLVDSLSANFEIGFHGDVHVAFKGQPAPEQERRMTTMRSQLGSVSTLATEGAIGFRAPFESYDATTEQLLHKSGIRYHLTDPNRSDSQIPFFVPMDGVAEADELLVIPRTQPDDIALLKDNPDTQALLVGITTDMNETIRYGGLTMLSVHSQNFAAGSRLSQALQMFLPELLSKRDQRLAWVASARDVDAWWRQRRRVTVAGQPRGGGLEVNITVSKGNPVLGTSVIVNLPNRNMRVQVRSTKVGQAMPVVRPLDEFRSELLFDSLEPGNYSYIVNLSEPEQ